jgi:two-component system sensor histidine kinase RegB
MTQEDVTSFDSLAVPMPALSLRLRVQIFLRWLAVIGQLVAVLVVSFGFGFPLPLVELLFVIFLSVALNIWLGLRYPFSHLLTRGQTAGYLAYDLAQLSALLYLTGGLINPFALLFLAPVTISASLLDARTTAILVAFASLLVTGLLFFYQPLPWQGEAPQIPELYRMGLFAALLLALAFVPSYVWRVSREGRRMSAAFTATRSVLAREQRLSALDGLAAAAAHQLGTPLGTIVLVSRELQNSPELPASLLEDVALMREQALRCREILTSLTSDEDLDPVVLSLSLTGLLEEAVLEVGPQEKQIHVSCEADATLATREPRLQRRPELIYGLGNIIENATEFADANVWLKATYSAQQICIEVLDDGPGFSSDILAHLGEPYTSSRRHNGRRDDGDEFGLGLGFFIARTLLQRSGGQILTRNLRPMEAEKLASSLAGAQTKGTGASVRITWPRERLEQNH